jgi:hypothetical protein
MLVLLILCQDYKINKNDYSYGHYTSFVLNVSMLFVDILAVAIHIVTAEKFSKCVCHLGDNYD